MSDNKIIFVIIGVVLAVLLANNLQLFSVLPVEEQFKLEYNTIWSKLGDASSSDFTTSGAVQFGTGQYMDYGTWTDNNGEYILMKSIQSLTLDNKDYKGQKMVFYLTGKGYGDSVDVGVAGGCNVEGASLSCKKISGTYYTTCDYLLVEILPKRDTTQVYVKRNGVIINEITVTGQYNPTISCWTNSEPRVIEFFGLIDFIGYQAQYECDLSSDEVWVEETFAQDFTIDDLEFVPTKFCQATRPMILRNIDLGETSLSREDGIDLLNTGKTIPVGTNELVIVNYATYYVEGVNNKCEPNEANIKINGEWVCQSIIEPITVVVQCQQDSDCPINCGGITASCVNNFCEYSGDCIIPPPQKESVWSLIQEAFSNLWNAIKAIFGIA